MESSKTLITYLVLYAPLGYNSNNNIYHNDYKFFQDYSQYSHSVNQFGNTYHRHKNNVLPTYEQTVKFGLTSIYFNGVSDYLVVPDNNDFNLATNNFTLEFWVYLVQLDTNQTFITKSEGAGSDSSFNIGIDSNNKILINITNISGGWDNTKNYTSNSTITNNNGIILL